MFSSHHAHISVAEALNLSRFQKKIIKPLESDAYIEHFSLYCFGNKQKMKLFHLECDRTKKDEMLVRCGHLRKRQYIHHNTDPCMQKCFSSQAENLLTFSIIHLWLNLTDGRIEEKSPLTCHRTAQWDACNFMVNTLKAKKVLLLNWSTTNTFVCAVTLESSAADLDRRLVKETLSDVNSAQTRLWQNAARW